MAFDLGQGRGSTYDTLAMNPPGAAIGGQQVTELDSIGHRLAATINEASITLEQLQTLQDKLLGASPQPSDKVNSTVSAVPNGTLAQANVALDVLADKMQRAGNIIQRLRQAL